MNPLIVSATSGDQSGLRKLRDEVRAGVVSLTGDAELADRLAGVVWELLTNLAHAASCDRHVLIVEIEARRVVVRLPGQPFDSVHRAKEPGARGLDTAAYRLELAQWTWSHRHADGINETCLEDTRRRT